MRLPTRLRLFVCILGTGLASACAGSGSTPSTPAYPPAVAPGFVPTTAAHGIITHVVVIVQENRSFDNMFHGFPGADTVNQGKLSSGNTIALQPVSMTETYDLSHELIDYVHDYDGGALDGFDKGATGSIYTGGVSGPTDAPKDPQYMYLQPSDTAEYFALASSYVLADRFFTSQLDSSFTAHQYLIAAQAGGAVNQPPATVWGCDTPAGVLVPTITAKRTLGPGEVPCFTYQTLGDELDAAGIGWRYYAPAVGGDPAQIWSAYDAIQHIRYGSDWTSNVISPETTVLTDIAAGTLAPVTWVIPDLANSDHPGSASSTGPDWVSSVVNAVGTSPFWSSTAIVVFWDDWGGWYDHVRPPQLDVDGLGFRTPMMVISPYAKSGYVSHVQYETASIDRFIEGVFAIPTLSAADSRAATLDDCFDFTQAPRAFSAFTTRTSPSTLIHRRPSNLPPDTD